MSGKDNNNQTQIGVFVIDCKKLKHIELHRHLSMQKIIPSEDGKNDIGINPLTSNRFYKALFQSININM